MLCNVLERHSPESAPASWGTCTPSNTWFLGSTDSASQTVQPFLHSSRHSVPILYNGRPFPKIAPSNGDLDPISNTWFLEPTRAHNPNGISIGSVDFVGFTWQTDRQTDKPRNSVCDNRPHMRPNNKQSKWFDNGPHRRRTWTVQWYSPGGASVHQS